MCTKYDVDGAIIVFVQDKKWRLSFVSEIKMLNDEGEVIEQATEPKRYTYLLGEGEKVRTPSGRLAVLSNPPAGRAGKTLSIQDILNAFSVEALNEEFYKIIQAFFYELVGGKVGKGRKQNGLRRGCFATARSTQSKPTSLSGICRTPDWPIRVLLVFENEKIRIGLTAAAGIIIVLLCR